MQSASKTVDDEFLNGMLSEKCGNAHEEKCVEMPRKVGYTNPVVHTTR